MSASAGFKISFSKTEFLIRVALKHSATIQSDRPPADLIPKVTKKMEQLKKNGSISQFIIFEERLHQAWRAISLNNFAFIKNDQPITFTIAAGFPELPGFTLKVENDTPLMSIDKKHLEVLKGYKPRWFQYFVEHQLNLLHIHDKPDRSLLNMIQRRALAGQLITDVPISMVSHKKNTLWTYRAWPENEGLSVYIHNIKCLLSKKRRLLFYSSIEKEVTELSQEMGYQYRYLKEQIDKDIKLSVRGIEVLGAELPLSILVGLKTNTRLEDLYAGARTKASSGKSKKSTKKNSQVQKSDPDTQANQQKLDSLTPEMKAGIGLLKLDIDTNKLNAKIVEFNTDWYNDERYNICWQWLRAELERYGIQNHNRDITVKLKDHLREQQDINGLPVAEGSLPTTGEQPYIVQIHKEVDDNKMSGAMDMRQNRNVTFAYTGDLIGRLAFETEGTDGKDVYGEIIKQKVDYDTLGFAIGEDIRVEAGRYYATSPGIPKITKNSIEIEKVYEHQGDIDLASGDVSFDGPIVIHGSIETGATVISTGDVIVEGGIYGGNVVLKGTLNVTQGIVGCKDRRIECEELTAGFIESSRVLVHHDANIQRNIMNSEVIIGGDLKLTEEDSMVAGGRLSVYGVMQCSNLGMKGLVGEVFMGSNWRRRSRLDHWESRYEKIKNAWTTLKNELATIRRKGKHELTKKHVEKKELLTKQNERYRNIINKIEEKVEVLHNTDKEVNEECKIVIKAELNDQTKIVMGEQEIEHGEIAKIEILPVPRRGRFIHPIDEDQLEADNAEDKPKKNKSTEAA